MKIVSESADGADGGFGDSIVSADKVVNRSAVNALWGGQIKDFGRSWYRRD